MIIELENVRRLKVVTSRWSVKLELETAEGETQAYIASADNGVTYGDGIFFGTPEDLAEVSEW